MKLSIVIPSYNTEKYVGACLFSCTNKPDTEVILIDDGSSDSTAKIASETPGVKFYQLEHGGVSKARNFGLDKAKGEYVWFVDSDDLINPDGLKHVLKRCDGKENIIRFNHYRYYKAKDQLKPRFEQPPYRVWFHERQFLWEVVWDRIYKRSFLLENNLRFDEKINFGEDQLFNLEALHTNNGYIQDGHFVYVKTWNNPKSITHQLTLKERQANIDGLKRLKKKYNDDKDMIYEIDFQMWKLKQLPSFKGVK